MNITVIRMREYTRPGLLVVLLLAPNPCSFAETVFKWSDSDGVTHFSQKPPSNSTTRVDVIELDTPRPSPQAADNYYSIVNQARRMEEDRRKREQENLDRRLAIQQAQQNDYEDRESDNTDTGYIPVYSYYGHRRPYYSGYRRGKRGFDHSTGYRPGIGKHPKPAPYRNAQRRNYPRAVVNTGR